MLVYILLKFDRDHFYLGNSNIVSAMKIMWQSAESQVFMQRNFGNIRREMIIETLLQRFEDNSYYPVNVR